jgi:hypothetical protein
MNTASGRQNSLRQNILKTFIGQGGCRWPYNKNTSYCNNFDDEVINYGSFAKAQLLSQGTVLLFNNAFKIPISEIKVLIAIFQNVFLIAFIYLGTRHRIRRNIPLTPVKRYQDFE